MWKIVEKWVEKVLINQCDNSQNLQDNQCSFTTSISKYIYEKLMQMVLKFENNVSKKEYSFDVIDNNLSQIFYNFNITLPEGMDDGEYTYRLYEDNTVLATGLVQVGDYTPQKTIYNKDKHEFIQYQPE